MPIMTTDPLASKQRRVQALIFDMDGVLFLTSKAHAHAYSQALNGAGVAFDETCYATVAGMRTDQAMAKICAERGLHIAPAQLAELASSKALLARKYLESHPPVDDECYEVLHHLRRSFRLVLCSSASTKNVQLFLTASKTKDLFELVIDGDQASNAKPDPQMYMLSLAKLRLEPADVFVIEDSIAGIEAANRAGARVIARVGLHSATELRAAGAAATFISLSQLDGLLP